MAKKTVAMVGVGMNKIGGIDRWQVENDLSSFERCAQVKKDPKRLKAVQQLAEEKLKEYAYVMGEVKEPKGEA